MRLRKRLAAAAISLAIFMLGGCGQSANQAPSTEQPSVSMGDSTEAKSEKTFAKDNAEIQNDDSSIATRIPMENGTRIKMTFGDTIITGVLNDSETAKALIDKLPYTQHMSRYSHDFCGVTEELPYQEEKVHYGWLNGDIDYATNAPYFTILFEDEENSEQYGNQVNIGVITSPLSSIRTLDRSYDVVIELDD